MSQTKTIGVLLINLGTPDAPSASAVRRYLREFLSDPRVIELPRWLWLPILYGLVLPFRPRRAAQNYKKIWLADGSPLRIYTQRLAIALEKQLRHHEGASIKVEAAMRYGSPSLTHGLNRLRANGAERLLILPLYPQYSATTTASSFDAVAAVMAEWRVLPELRLVRDYHAQPAYLDALADSVRAFRSQQGAGDRLLLSFHGLPERYAKAGDPYPLHCQHTAEALAQRLGLKKEEWQMSFQSRFGKAKWLGPYTDATLRRWGHEGLARVDVICPGFAADCLETLEEIQIQNRELFLASGGGDLRYIPALNDSPNHIQALTQIAQRHLAGW